MLDVVEIAFYAFFDAGITAPAIDLSPSSDSGLGFMAEIVTRYFATKLLYKYRTLWPRTHQTHLTAQDIKELRQLVEASTPQPLAHRSGTVIPGTRPYSS